VEGNTVLKHAMKMLIDMPKDIEERAGTAPPPEASPLSPADEEMVENLLARLRRAELAKIHHGDTRWLPRALAARSRQLRAEVF
jgi:hypothetical protein